jgi:hypothetical protein
VKKQRLFIFMTCLLFGAVAGCHKPASSVVLVAGPDNGIAVDAEEGGVLEFRTESANTFTISMKDSPCKDTDVLTGTKDSPVKCHIKKNTNKDTPYTFTITETGPSYTTNQAQAGSGPPPSKAITAYIRPAPPGTHGIQ